MSSLARARALCVLPFLLAMFPAQPVQASTPPRAATPTPSPATSPSPSPVPSPSPSPSPSPDQTQPVAGQQSPGTPTAASPTTGTATPQSTQTVTNGGNPALHREVFGYATSGSLGDPNFGYTTWNFDELSTVAFFAIHVDASGVLVADSNWTVWNSSTLTGLVNTAHAHGVKVVVALRNPSDMCSALYNSDTTTLQIVNQVVSKGIDGVNIDYEGNLIGSCPQTGQSDQTMLTTFAQRLRTALDNVHPGYYLSIATYSGSALGNDGFFNIPALNQYVDSFFVMAYDMDYANQGLAPLNTCTSFCMAPVSPLANYYWNDSASMSQYSAVVPASKVLLGQPYYGRVACVSSPTAHAHAVSNLTPASYLDAAAAISSPDIKPGTYSINRDGDDPAGLDRWDAWWDLSLNCWREMYWSDTTTLGARYNLVNQDNLRGVGLWTLNYGGGASELWNLLATYFIKCLTASITPQTQAQPAGSTVTMTASSTGCVVPQYAFWVQYPDGSWHLAQNFSSSATFSWNTYGLAPGNYNIHVWANAMGNTYDAVGSATVTLSPCASASLDPASSTQPIGATVTLTASSTGCPYPRYEYWVQYPDASWHLAQGFSSNATFNWSTVGLSPGDYTIHDWVNTIGSGYDAFGSATVTLTGCLSASLTPASVTQEAGSTVNFTASSTGCAYPRYAFWVQYPDTSWHFLQGFSTNATFNWNTTGLAPGAYNVHVWVNRSGSGYDAVGSATATLTGCASAALTPASGSSAAGSVFSFTASATGCSVPTFEFWLQDPSGGWHFVRGYSTNGVWTWNTTGWAKGTYTIHVWANQSGSSLSTYQAIGTATYTLT